MTRIGFSGFSGFWQRIQPRKLRDRIMTLVGLVNLAILILTLASVTIFVNRVESDAWRGRQLETARNAAQTIAAFLQRNEDALEWMTLFGYDEVINQPATLNEVLDNYPAFLEIVVLDREGHTLAVAARKKVLLGNLFTTPQAEWFRAARAGQKYYTRVQMSALDEPYLIFAMPAGNERVIAARIKMDVLRQVVADIHFGAGGSVFVVNQAGQVNAHTDPNIVLDNVSMERNPEFQVILRAPNREWQGERLNFKRQKVVSASTAVSQTNWTVITELPMAEAYAASRLINVALPVGMLMLLFATTLVIRSSMFQMFLKSVDLLRNGAARIGEGDLGFRMQIPRMDELGEVMSVFNQMAARLEAQRLGLEQRAVELQASEQRYRLLNEELEARVQVRTLELSQLNSELLSEIDERRRAEESLNTSLHEKEVLLKEVHHRVKNNLQIISSLLSLQSRNVMDARTMGVLRDSQNRVRSMALIHEKLYQSNNLAQVNFREYIQSLVPALLRFYLSGQDAVTLSIEVDDVPLNLASAIPCGLIVNELVTNTLKYAFPEGRSGMLWIELHQDHDQGFILRIADDGIGLPADLDINNLPSLGLQLVNSLVGQLEGSLEIDRRNGTAFIISFREIS